MRAEYLEEPCKTALNRVKGMPFAWSLNPYTGCVHRCTFCYVRAFERRADRPSDDRYGRTIRVKPNIAEVLRARAGTALVGTRGGDDRRRDRPVPTGRGPLSPHPRLHRRALAARTPTSIITRGPLVWRDVDVLQEAAKRAEVSVNVSVPTLDDRVWRTTEPGTAPPRKRLEIVRRLVDAGIRTSVAIAPILPGISDGPEQLSEAVKAAREAGAHHIWASMLHLRPGTREHFLEALARDWPSESARYEQLYAGRSYLPRARRRPSPSRSGRSRASTRATAGRRCGRLRRRRS